MSTRGRKVNPDSDNQRFKYVLFGKDAKNQSNIWREWPEPQKSIYNRMFSNGWKPYSGAIAKQVEKLIQTVAEDKGLSLDND